MDAAPGNGDYFIIDDLLDIPNDDADAGLEAAMAGTSADSTVTAADASSFSAVAQPHFQSSDIAPAGAQFSGELCVPYDDFAAVDWLSIEEEPFCSEDLQKLQLIQGMKARIDEASHTHLYQFQPEIVQSGPMLRPEMSVPGKARSKRSRAVPGNWTSRLLMVSTAATVPPMSSSLESDTTKKAVKPAAAATSIAVAANVDGRRCLHCASDKTPQWRTGPMGPKTLCNACGVRYKSGRLVPEYRPASSPTFVLTKHSNSHRKVLELRRQKEMQRGQPSPTFLNHHHRNMMIDVSNGDDYLIHHHIGPDYRQLI